MNYLHYLFRAPDVMKSEGLSAGIQFRSETQIAGTAAFSTSFKREFVKEDRFLPEFRNAWELQAFHAVLPSFWRSNGNQSGLFQIYSYKG